MELHTRSVSLTTRSHPFVLRAEEELNKLQACVGSSSLTHEIMLDALKAIGCVYESINELLCMSSNQNGISHMQHRRWVEQELEDSVKLLDMCSTSRDNLDSIKYHVLVLELATRRGDSETMKNKLRDYNLIVKKANRDVKMQIFNKNESAEGNSLPVFSLLLEAREITISVLQSIFSHLSGQIVSQKSSKWSLVSRLVEKRTIACKGDVACLRVCVEELENRVEISVWLLVTGGNTRPESEEDVKEFWIRRKGNCNTWKDTHGAAVIWNLWKTRNGVIFQSKNPNIWQVAGRAIQDCALWETWG
ncbi:hypothetical protein LUZ63_009718 [Rhynchospora breviuscula]|uniref:Uncharacterized protein n=1 Tax=Rhynchospora breviuscula TaxID=2022672 RepID=A0A9Q0CFV3_9POAL|nr:hypothetical protein LUZ63_009718 [Rhynchospora breviuscula]